MSRSYKKTPVLKYAPQGNIGQKFANRRVRRYKKDLSSGMSYKKLYSQYDIHDHVCRESLEEALVYRNRLIHDVEYGISRWGYVRETVDPDDEDINLCIQKWKKMYIRK